MVVGARAAENVQILEVVLDLVWDPVEVRVLVDRSTGATLARRAVVGYEHDHRVVELAALLEVVEQPADLVVGVAEEAGIDLGHASEQALLVVGQRVPGADGVGLGPFLGPVHALLVNVRVDRRQLGLLGNDAHLLLAVEHELAVGLVAHVELALVLVGPLLRGVMGRVARARAEVQEERLVGCDGLRVLDERQRAVSQVRGQVVALLGQRQLLDRVVVVHEIGIPLVGLGAEEPVEALEPAADRPLVLDRREIHLVLGRQVPFAGHVRVPPPLAEHLGDRPALERHVAVGAREARCGLSDRAHAVRGVVAAGHQARARRRAQRGRVEVREDQATLGDPIDVGCLDQAAEGLHRGVADVVEHDVEHARRALRRDRLGVRAPVRDRLGHVDVDRP
jgi:hypothetical protein